MVLVSCFLVLAVLAVVGCGEQGGGDSSGTRNPTVSASELFDVSDATAIAAASSSGVSTSDIRASSGELTTELLRITATGGVASVLTSAIKD